METHNKVSIYGSVLKCSLYTPVFFLYNFFQKIFSDWKPYRANIVTLNLLITISVKIKLHPNSWQYPLIKYLVSYSNFYWFLAVAHLFQKQKRPLFSLLDTNHKPLFSRVNLICEKTIYHEVYLTWINTVSKVQMF